MECSTAGCWGERAIDLICYVQPGWRPRLRAASPRRDWMDASPEAFAYRCLPLNIANAHGWEVLSPCGFEASWNGGPQVADVTVKLDRPEIEGLPPVAIFGQGVLTFHVEGLIRTPEGYSLWVGGPPNGAKDGIAPLTGVIETDWSPYTFTMNWRFTRPGTVRFEENEPFAFIFPVERGLLEAVAPRIAPIKEEAGLQERFATWSASRDKFRAEVEANPPAAASDHWQKFYYRGVDPDGSPGPPDHLAKLRLKEFSGADAFHRPGRARPATGVEPAPRPPPVQRAPAADEPRTHATAAKLAWTMAGLEQLRALGAEQAIPRTGALSAEAFLVQHYARNWPVVLAGVLDDWAAARDWSPDYLKAKVGGRAVQVQAERAADADYEQRMDAHAQTLPFDAFIDRIMAPGAGNDTYLTAYNSAVNEAALQPLHADLGFLDNYLTRDSRGMMWIGPAGTFTPLHHDLTNNLLLQVVGRKELIMAAPGETPKLYNDHHVYSRIRDLGAPDLMADFPDLEGVRVHHVTLLPGDALFIPLGWWHQVRSLDFSVSITHTNFRWPNDFHASFPYGR